MSNTDNHEPVFIRSGATPPVAPPSSPPVLPAITPQPRNYDFLLSWKMPERGFARLVYNTKCVLNRNFKANHEDYLKYQQYLAEVDAANAAYRAEVDRLNAEYQLADEASEVDYRQQFEQNERAYARMYFQAVTDYLIERLRYLDNLGIRPIMAFCNIKSAGKTTTLLQVLSVIAQYTRRTVLAIPATQNSATSTLALMAGIAKGMGVTIEELSRRIDELDSYRALSTVVPKTPNGVGIVSEDTNNALNVNDQYNLNKFIELLLKVLPSVDYIGLDLGNDNIRNDSIALAAARFAHVLNFSYLDRKPVTVRSLENTVAGYNTDTQLDLRYYRLDGFEDVLTHTGIGTPTPEKVAHSIVIANLAPIDAVIDYGKHMDPSQRVDSTLPQWAGVGINMPYDAWLDHADGSGEVKPVDLARITPVTHQQALRIAVANLEEAARVQKIDISDAPRFVAPQKPVITRFRVPEPVLPKVPVIEHPFPTLKK